MKQDIIIMKVKVLAVAFTTLIGTVLPSVGAHFEKVSTANIVSEPLSPTSLEEASIVMDEIEETTIITESTTTMESVEEVKPTETRVESVEEVKPTETRVEMIEKVIEETKVMPLSATTNTIQQELETYRGLPYFLNENFARYMNYKTKHPEYSYEDVITHVNVGLDFGFYNNVEKIVDPASITVLVNKFRQLPKDFVPELATISSDYASRTLQVTPLTKEAFERMCSDAATLGLSIKAVSAYRSYDYQYNLYWSKANPNNPASIARRDKVSARAGFSEHQTGLTLDIVGLDNWVDTTKEYAWYKDNAHLYGFILRYPNGKEHITGYSYEPWHIRYVGVELATAIYQSGLTYDEYYTRYIEPELQMKTLGVARVRV